MATAMARTEAAAGVGGDSSRHSLPPQSSRAAVESTVDAYATRILRTKSPPEASVDDSLGPYVTSIIRCSLEESSALQGGVANAVDVYDMNVEELIEDFESIVELLEGHCGMTPDVAKSALHIIAISVKTGVVDAFDDGEEHQDPDTAIGSFRSVGMLGTSLGSIMSFDCNHGCGRLGRPFRSKSVGASNDEEGMASIQMLGNMLRDTDIGEHNDAGAGFGTRGDLSPPDDYNDDFFEHPSFIMDEDMDPDDDDANRVSTQYHNHGVPGASALSTSQQSSNSASPDQGGPEHTGNMLNVSDEIPALTPMKLNRLIPEDLMGVLDNPATPAQLFVEPKNTPVHSDMSQRLDAAAQADTASDKLSKKGKGRMRSKSDAQDLAAALFRPSRARSNSVLQEKSPMLKPLSAPAPAMFSLSSKGKSDLFQQQRDSATQILLSMNGSLGEEAATEAALVSHNDVNVAQYVIDGALAAPPVCRHTLYNGCYRSDCHFSHDVEGHTCLFWLRGRCGKGNGCRFMHGFSEKLLEGIKKDFLPDQGAGTDGEGDSAIQTTNLVQHNMCMSSSVPKHAGRPFSFLNAPQGHDAASFSQMSASLPKRQVSASLPKQSRFLGASTPSPSASTSKVLPLPMHLSEDGQPSSQGLESSGSQLQCETPTSNSVSAWSNVAQRGYSLTSFSPSDDTEAAEFPSAKSKNRLKAVRIPQNLWNPSEKRCASVFHISDPLARYAEVSATHPRKDVVDLHYQSMKTFSVVLSEVLPNKLRQHREVWVLTGTGHHVARNSHQKSGGVLESAVMSWLDEHGYECARGKDRNGYCGAVLVKPR